MADLMGGQVATQFIGLSVALPHIKSGKLRALAVTSVKRSPVAPDIQAVAETVRGYELNTWFGVLGPGGMPAPLVERLQDKIARILHSAELKEYLASLGAEAVGNTPRQFAAHIRSEIDKYARIVKIAGVRVE